MNKVKNRKIINKITDRSLKARKSRNFIGILAIALTSVLFTSIFIIGGSIVEKQQKETMRQVGGSAHAGYKYLTEEEYQIVKKDSKLKSVSRRIVVGDAVNEELIKLTTEISYYEDLEAKWSFCYPEKGHMPEKENEIVTSDLVLKQLGIPCKIGEKVPVKMQVNGKIYEKTLTLCGYFAGDGIAMAQVMAVSKTFQEEIAPIPEKSTMGRSMNSDEMAGYIMTDFNFNTSFNLEKQVEELTKRCGFDSVAEGINWAYLGKDVDIMTVMLVGGMLLVVILSGYLLIYNIFYINVYGDIRYYGLLKTVGTTQKQLKKMVRRQAYILSAVGIPAGLLIGTGIGKLLLPVVMQNLFFAETSTYDVELNLWIFIGSALFSLITVRISCLKPCKIAAKVSPIEAVKYTEGQETVYKKKKKTRTVTPKAMAWGNLKRNKKKMCIVIASLSLSLILLNSIYSLVKGFDMDKFVSNRIVSDFAVNDATLDNVTVHSSVRVTDGVTEAFMEELSGQSGIEQEGKVYFKEESGELPEKDFERFDRKILQNPDVEKKLKEMLGESYEDSMKSWREFKNIGGIKYYGIDKLIFDKMQVLEGERDWEKFQTGNYVLVNRFPFLEEETIPYYNPGEKVTIHTDNGKSREYEVMAVAEMPYAAEMQSYGIFDCTYILPSEEYIDFLGKQQPMRILFNVASEEEEAIEKWVENYCENVNSDLDYTSKSTIVKEFDTMKNMYSMVGGMLCFILAVIGILNFVNTMASSMLSRKQQFASLEAVGMTGKQLQKMLCIEGVYYAGITAVVSVVVGSILNMTVIRQFGKEFFFFKGQFTVLPLFICIPVLFLIVILVPVIGFRKIRVQSVVERLRIIE